MADNLEKLTKLEALKQLAERVNTDFATKGSVETLEGKVESLETVGSEKNKIEKIKVNNVEQDITPEDRSVNISVPTKVSELTDHEQYATVESLNAKISSVYKPGGSKLFSELPEANKDNLGTVYNVTDGFTTDDKFVDENGNKYPKGTNVVVVSTEEGVYKYDVLAGFVDLSEYAKTSEVVKKDGDKVLSSNDYTNEDKAKLDSLKNYEHPTSDAGAKESGLYKIATDANGHITSADKVSKEDITGLGIPDSDTTYKEATQSVSGLMSSNDKKKLDNIEIATKEEVDAVLEEVFGGE